MKADLGGEARLQEARGGVVAESRGVQKKPFEERLLSWSRILCAFGAAFLLIEIFLTMANITGRYLFQNPIPSTYEACQLFMVVVLSFSWGYTQLTGGHVRVDTFDAFMPARMRQVLDVVIFVLSVFAYTAIAWSMVLASFSYYRLGSSTDILGIPLFPFAWLMALGALFGTVGVVLQLTQLLKTMRRGGA